MEEAYQWIHLTAQRCKNCVLDKTTFMMSRIHLRCVDYNNQKKNPEEDDRDSSESIIKDLRDKNKQKYVNE